MEYQMEPQAAVEELQRQFHALKAGNEEEMRQIKAAGSSDVLTREKIERLDKVVQGLQDRVMKQQLAAKRSPKSFETANVDPLSEERGKAFMAFLRKGSEAELLALEQKAMTVVSDPEGGFAVPVEFASRILEKQLSITPLRQLANVMEISSEAVEMLSDRNEAEANWVAETAARSDTNTPNLARVRIPAHEISAQPKASQKLLDDAAINIEEWLISKVSDRFARREGDAFINGDGVTRPRGILSYATSASDDDTRAWGQLQHVATGVSGGFPASNAGDKLLDLVYKLRAPFLSRASWLMPRSVAGAIRKIKGGDGNYVWQVSLQSGQPPTLLGFPVYFSEDMPAMGANSLSLAFGDFNEGYTIVDRNSLRLLRDPYTDKPNVKFYLTKRVGGDVVNFDAIKLMKFI